MPSRPACSTRAKATPGSSWSAWASCATAAPPNSANPISVVIPTTSSPSSARPPSSRDPATTRMFREAAQAPAVVARQLARNERGMHALGELLRAKPPRAVVTLARGSSDHAATYAKYLLETRLGVLTSSAAPSTASVYGAQPDLTNCLVLAMSQSGRSPDLVASVQAAKRAGARIATFVNDESSPLAALADHCIPLAAGAPEKVAPTKTPLAPPAPIGHPPPRRRGGAKTQAGPAPA